jgi:hypothetical protein
VSIVNAVLAFFAIDAMLNLGTQLETGTMIDAWETYKAVAGAVWAVTFLAAIALIIVAVA